LILESIQSINVSMCIPACDGLYNKAMNVDVKYLINTKFGKSICATC